MRTGFWSCFASGASIASPIRCGSFLPRLSAVEPKRNGRAKIVQGSLFDEVPEETHEEATEERFDRAWDGKWEVMDTPEKLGLLVDKLRAAPQIAFTIQGSSDRPREGDIVGIAFCSNAGESVYVPSMIGGDKTLTALRPIFTEKFPRKVAHNVKPAFQLLLEQGVELARRGGRRYGGRLSICTPASEIIT